jgi:hypothetical protein
VAVNCPILQHAGNIIKKSLRSRGERDQNLLVETETEILDKLVSTLRLRLILFMSSIKARY